MIKGFDSETGSLTFYEEFTLLPVIIAGLKNKVGSKRAVKNGYICASMRKAGYDLTEVRFRKIINYIRTNNLLVGLIATSSGYYIAENRREVEDYADSLQGRESAIRQVRECIQSQMRYY